MTNYNDGNWHGWNGGECPAHPDSVVEVRLESKCLEGPDMEGCAKNWTWERLGLGGDIIAFRVTKEHKEPREFWVCVDNKGHIGAVLRHKPDDMYGVVHVREVMDTLRNRQ